MGESVTVDGTTVTVSNPRLRMTVPFSGMHVLPRATDGGQFVVVDVVAEGSSVEQVTGSLGPVGDDGPIGAEPVPAVETGVVGVPFPVASYESAAIRWDAGTSVVDWTLPASVRTLLAQTATFSVTEFDAGRRDGERVVSITADNSGERDGRFLGRVSFEGFSGGELVSFDVAAGESNSYRGRPGSLLTMHENSGGGRFTLLYYGPEGRTTVEAPAPTTTE